MIENGISDNDVGTNYKKINWNDFKLKTKYGSWKRVADQL